MKLLNIFKKSLNREILKFLKSEQLTAEHKQDIQSFINKLKKDSIDSIEIIELYHYLVKFGFKEKAQYYLYVYLDNNYNDQNVITLLNQNYRLEHQKRSLIKWEKLGKPVPVPHVVKQNLIKGHARKYNNKIFVETGTFFGDMIEATKDYFDKIYSIELSKDLYLKACERFKNDKNVILINGDSGKEIKNVLMDLSLPAIFFLDGHYSGSFTAKGEKDTPIFEELNHILSVDIMHTIIIDDARLFGTDPSYPTIPDLMDYIKKRKSNLNIEIVSDSIVITP